VYGDECYTRVYAGTDGAFLVEIPNSNDTIREYPIVADVDGDNNSEMVVVANDAGDTADCVETIPGYTARRGVYVYGDANDQWVRTRQVWTQHTYHVTNATSNGLTPPIEDANWLDSDLNNYRQNTQGEGVFNAPDVSVDLTVGTSNCLNELFDIVATVRNTGSVGVPAGIGLTLYEGTDASGTVLDDTASTPVPLLPGQFVEVVYQVPAPGDTPSQFYVSVDNPNGMGTVGAITECNEDNNEAATTTVSCMTPG